MFPLKPTETFEQIFIAESASQFGPSAGYRFAWGFAGSFSLPSLVAHPLQFRATVWNPRQPICLGQLAETSLKDAATWDTGVAVDDTLVQIYSAAITRFICLTIEERAPPSFSNDSAQ